jgi:tetratricopeptide (TPR) repeat protein
MKLRGIALALGLLGWSGQLAAQRPVVGAMAMALAAERRGALDEAVTAFRLVLESRPGDGQAILGLSRVLPPLDRRAELVAPLRAALAVDSTNIGFLSLAVRTFSLLGNQDSARAYVERWAVLVEGEEEPYREWALSALEARDRSSAEQALEYGRARIAHPAALAPELAQLRQAEGDIAGATREWIRAIVNAPTFRASALLLLGDLLPPGRDTVLAVLAASGEVEAERLRALFLVKWGQPEAGVRLLATVAPESYEVALSIFRIVLDELKGRADRGANRARGMALELQAGYETGATRVRTRMDAARSWADAGEEGEARRLLARVATDPAAPPGVATSASSTLLGVLLAEGRPAEAESLLVDLRGSLSLDEWDRDARRVAMAWARRGDVERGESLLAIDSSIAGFNIRGRLRAFVGDLATATDWLRVAGPYDVDRGQTVRRVRLLSLFRAVERDTLPALGAALLSLERGDTVAAVTELGALAPTLDPGGTSAVRLFAAELAVAAADTAGALALLAAADHALAPATAPSARLLRARLLAEHGDVVRAQEMLETIILEFPDSAVLPAARRLRDAMRGAIPT